MFFVRLVVGCSIQVPMTSSCATGYVNKDLLGKAMKANLVEETALIKLVTVRVLDKNGNFEIDMTAAKNGDELNQHELDLLEKADNIKNSKFGSVLLNEHALLLGKKKPNLIPHLRTKFIGKLRVSLANLTSCMDLTLVIFYM